MWETDVFTRKTASLREIQTFYAKDRKNRWKTGISTRNTRIICGKQVYLRGKRTFIREIRELHAKYKEIIGG